MPECQYPFMLPVSNALIAIQKPETNKNIKIISYTMRPNGWFWKHLKACIHLNIK